MAYLDKRFPERISFGAIGGPGFNTGVVTVTSGKESRNRNWSKMRHSFEASYGAKTEADFREIRAHFMAAGGKADWFAYKDWSDFKVEPGEGVAVLLTSTTFQLAKAYVSGSVTTVREILLPYDVLVNVPGSVDPLTGIFTASAPHAAADISWTGFFDVPARYDTDELKATIINRSAEPDRTPSYVLSWESVPLIEVRDEDEE